MKKLESSLLNMVLVLTGVAVIMGGVLAYVNHLTEGPINEQKAQALADGIKAVMVCDDLLVSKTDTVRQNDSKGKELTYIIYQTKDKQGKDLGAAVESTTGGFGGDLKVLVGFDPDGKILGYRHHRQGPCRQQARRYQGRRRRSGCHHGIDHYQPCLPLGHQQCV